MCDGLKLINKDEELGLWMAHSVSASCQELMPCSHSSEGRN